MRTSLESLKSLAVKGREQSQSTAEAAAGLRTQAESLANRVKGLQEQV